MLDESKSVKNVIIYITVSTQIRVPILSWISQKLIDLKMKKKFVKKI